MKQVFVCPCCHRRYDYEQRVVDEVINCGCGFVFYVFGHQGLTIQLPEEEANEAVCEALRRLVRTTGRFPDAPSPGRRKGFAAEIGMIPPLALIEMGLQRMQTASFGGQILHSGDVESILEILNEKKDALVKRQNGYVTVMEQKVRNRKKGEVDYLRLMEEGFGYDPEGPGEAPPEESLRPWQMEIMEEDQARTGYLFGDVV